MQNKRLASKNMLLQNRYTGILLKLGGIIFSVLGLLTFMFRIGVRSAGVDRPIFSVLFIVSGLFFSLSIVMYRYGKKLTASTGKEVLSKDARPPVLYLRSFLDDDMTSTEIEGMLPYFIPHFDKTEEEILARIFSRIGPCIAIGEPGEKLPKLGMARMYLDDQEWQSRVQDLISRASVVVIRVGHTKNVWWEIETAVKLVMPERLLFLLPFEGGSTLFLQNVADDYGRFQREIEKYIPCKLPPYSASRVLKGSLTGVLFFESDWTPQIIAFDSISIGKRLSAKALLKESLKPFLKRFTKEN